MPAEPFFDFDELAQLELRIAQRADAMQREAGGSPIDFWQAAEQEVWTAFAPSAEPATV